MWSGRRSRGWPIVLQQPAQPWPARTNRGLVDLAAVASVFGEVAIPERAFNEGLSLEGTIGAVLLVENLGAWRDLPALDGWLFAHVPGWDTATASLTNSEPGGIIPR